MNVVPTEFTRVMPDALRAFVAALFGKVGVLEADAALMAELLVTTDLRGVFSHGTRQAPGYAGLLRDRKLNPRPQVCVVQESPATAVLDGDGGLGHFASWRAAHLAVEKAKAIGLGAVTTRNHHHFGAAGKYTRVASDAGLVGFAVSAHVPAMSPGQMVLTAGGGSPMSFAVPAGDGPSLVLDMGANFYSRRAGDFDDVFEKMPAAFFKGLGLGAVCQALGGILAGTWTVEAEGRAWPAVNQGAFILAVDISRFAPPEVFRAQMDDYVARARAMRPFPGCDRTDLPGGLEWERERAWAETGIPVGPEHRARLEAASEELGVRAPF